MIDSEMSTYNDPPCWLMLQLITEIFRIQNHLRENDEFILPVWEHYGYSCRTPLSEVDLLLALRSAVDLRV